MDALFGAISRQQHNPLTALAAQLRHRSGADISQYHQDGIYIGYGSAHKQAWQRRHHSGIASIGHSTIAVAGFFTGAQSLNLSPEIILRHYLEQGDVYLNQLNGAFVLVISQGQQGLVMRDGAGQRSVYYTLLNNGLYFATEPKALHQLPGFHRQLDNKSLAQYLCFSFVPGKYTMLKGLYSLAPGYRLYWQQEGDSLRVQSKRYYVFEDLPKQQQSEQHWQNDFSSAFADCVAERLPTHEPVGIFLSGGLDSSVVTAEVARQHRQPIHTYSLHFGKAYPHELEFAKMVAQRYNTIHHEVQFKPKKMLRRLREIIWYLDEPTGDPITAPNYELAAHAREDVNWIFNGEGGDPCFGGPKNYGMLLQHWYGGIERGPYFREHAYLQSFKRAYDEIDTLFTPEFRRSFNIEEDLFQVLQPYFLSRQPRGFLDKLMAMNIRLKGAHLILPKVERMLGAHGLPSMSPLFDERMINISFTMPSKLKLSAGDEKLIMKYCYRRHLPEEIISRPKSGMRVPVHYWFQRELKRYIKHIFSPKEVRRAGIFDAERIKRLINYDVEENSKRYGLKLWMLMTFEIWRRLVIEGERV